MSYRDVEEFLAERGLDISYETVMAAVFRSRASLTVSKHSTCARGASPYGYPNIIDITNEKHPTIVAKLKLEASEAANCNRLIGDPPDTGAGAPAYVVESSCRGVA